MRKPEASGRALSPMFWRTAVFLQPELSRCARQEEEEQITSTDLLYRGSSLRPGWRPNRLSFSRIVKREIPSQRAALAWFP